MQTNCESVLNLKILFYNKVVRLRVAGLLAGVKYSRVSDSAWHVVTTRTEVGLVDKKGNYPTLLE